MEKEKVAMPEYRNDATLPSPVFPGSHMALDDDYIFLSGLTAADIHDGEAAIGDVGEETLRIMRELRRMLETAGGNLDDTVRVDVHLADLDDITAMDAIYAEFFTAGRYPARTCTQSPKLFGGCRVEITLMARRQRGTLTMPAADADESGSRVSPQTGSYQGANEATE